MTFLKQLPLKQKALLGFLIVAPIQASAKLTCLDLKAIQNNMPYAAIKEKIGEPQKRFNKNETQYKWVVEGVTLTVSDFGNEYAKTLYGYTADNQGTCKVCLVSDINLSTGGKFPLKEVVAKLGQPMSTIKKDSQISHWEIDDYGLNIETQEVKVVVKEKDKDKETIETQVVAIVPYGTCEDPNEPEKEVVPYQVPRLRNKENFE